MGAWIEMALTAALSDFRLLSLPSWERGLKLWKIYTVGKSDSVAPLVGAWIEIFDIIYHIVKFSVAPLVGAWIEILRLSPASNLHIRRSPRGSVD